MQPEKDRRLVSPSHSSTARAGRGRRPEALFPATPEEPPRLRGLLPGAGAQRRTVRVMLRAPETVSFCSRVLDAAVTLLASSSSDCSSSWATTASFRGALVIAFISELSETSAGSAQPPPASRQPSEPSSRSCPRETPPTAASSPLLPRALFGTVIVRVVVLVVVWWKGRRLTRIFSLAPTLTVSRRAELYRPPFTETSILVMCSCSYLLATVELKLTLSMVTSSVSLFTSASAA